MLASPSTDLEVRPSAKGLRSSMNTGSASTTREFPARKMQNLIIEVLKAAFHSSRARSIREAGIIGARGGTSNVGNLREDLLDGAAGGSERVKQFGDTPGWLPGNNRWGLASVSLVDTPACPRTHLTGVPPGFFLHVLKTPSSQFGSDFSQPLFRGARQGHGGLTHVVVQCDRPSHDPSLIR